jgi:hypothetical protein
MNFLSSLSLLQTSALWGLVALAIPIAIHLFNLTRGKIVWVGNLSLFELAAKKRVAEVKLTQWWLLLLRLLLITLMTLLLARLVIESPQPTTPKTRVYLSGDWLTHADARDLNQLVDLHQNDSLYLLSGKNQNQDSRVYKIDPVSADELSRIALSLKPQPFAQGQSVNLFARLAELHATSFLSSTRAELATRPSHTIVYASDRLREYPYVQSSLPTPIIWRLKSVLEKPLQAPIRVRLIYSANRIIDQQFVTLALNFLMQENPAAYQSQSDLLSDELLANLPSENRPDWVIFLADSALPESIQNWVDQGVMLFTDQGARPTQFAKDNQPRTIARPEGVIQVFQSAPLAVRHEAADNNDNHLIGEQKSVVPVALWNDSQGHPILVQHQNIHYQWLSRFHPHSSDWVTQVNFPYMLASVLAAARPASQAARVDATFVDKYRDERTAKAAPAIPLINHSLDEWLLLFLCLLWLVERSVAEKVRREQSANIQTVDANRAVTSD